MNGRTKISGQKATVCSMSLRTRILGDHTEHTVKRIRLSHVARVVVAALVFALVPHFVIAQNAQDRLREEQERQAERQREEQQREQERQAEQQREEQQRAQERQAEQQREEQQREEQQREQERQAEQQREEQQRGQERQAEQQREEQQREQERQAEEQREEQQREQERRAEQQREQQQREQQRQAEEQRGQQREQERQAEQQREQQRQAEDQRQEQQQQPSVQQPWRSEGEQRTGGSERVAETRSVTNPPPRNVSPSSTELLGIMATRKTSAAAPNPPQGSVSPASTELLGIMASRKASAGTGNSVNGTQSLAGSQMVNQAISNQIAMSEALQQSEDQILLTIMENTSDPQLKQAIAQSIGQPDPIADALTQQLQGLAAISQASARQAALAKQNSGSGGIGGNQGAGSGQGSGTSSSTNGFCPDCAPPPPSIRNCVQDAGAGLYNSHSFRNHCGATLFVLYKDPYGVTPIFHFAPSTVQNAGGSSSVNNHYRLFVCPDGLTPIGPSGDTAKYADANNYECGTGEYSPAR
jgi:hypothetical protein